MKSHFSILLLHPLPGFPLCYMQHGHFFVLILLSVPVLLMFRRDHVLQAVVTYTEELAQEQATAADKLLSEGTYLGQCLDI
jgi:hypothetical protein